MGSGCKPDGFAYGGSNPSWPTTSTHFDELTPSRGDSKWQYYEAMTLMKRAPVRSRLRLGRWIHRRYLNVATGIESLIQFLEGRYTPLGRFTPGEFENWDFLWRPMVWGFVAITAIVAGCSFSNSPFKLEVAHTWFFGVPTSLQNSGTNNETTLLYSITLVFGGLVMLMRVWLRLSEVLQNHVGAPLKKLYLLLGVWCAPLIVAPPLFSRDVFSYAAQGEMTSYHISPYTYGPFTLGQGSNPFTLPVDPLWGNTPAPYGPLFLAIDGFLVRLTHHHELASVVLLRLLEVAAVVIMAIALPLLARGMKRDAGEILILGAANPVVLLTLLGGVHNDGVMAALLALGIALATVKRPMWGFFFVACATAIKAPAALGLLYIAWSWQGSGVALTRRLTAAVKGGLISLGVLGAATLAAGFGLGWVKNLSTPGTVRSWAAPATGLGLGLAKLFNACGWDVSVTPVLTVTRVFGFLLAIGLSGWLFATSDRRGWVRSLAVSLILFVVLGPVVQPWYLSWGLVLLGASYVQREHFWLLTLSIVAPFIGLPGGRQLLNGLIHANVFEMVSVLAILAGMFLVPLGRWTQWSWPGVNDVRGPGLEV